MADKKVVFVAFAIEDVRIRDLIKAQSLLTDTPFEYVDMSVKEPYDEDWKNTGSHPYSQIGRSFGDRQQELSVLHRTEMGDSMC